MKDSIYHEMIIELSKSPVNKKVPASFDLYLKAQNANCGDNLGFYIKFDTKKKISEIFWDGEGCALSSASASIFTILAKGKKISELKQISAKKLLDELHLKNLTPSRLKCALLPLESI